MKINLRNIVGVFLLTSSLVVGTPSLTTKVLGRGVQYTSAGLEQVFKATKNIGKFTGDTGE